MSILNIHHTVQDYTLWFTMPCLSKNKLEFRHQENCANGTIWWKWRHLLYWEVGNFGAQIHMLIKCSHFKAACIYCSWSENRDETKFVYMQGWFHKSIPGSLYIPKCMVWQEKEKQIISLYEMGKLFVMQYLGN